ncbi:preprotein translocase subunit SecG [Candidatus Amesbacteria bacterium RIFOXYB1_FULL_44_23]|uniref:Protein-export membrane protein SecG n=1 Tax=Candidatus Amesbacteria bacterium RIFOXYB1_FULL_44_23 TaxID=1797263 RepID=A0A1F4ZRX3_9BACT|nr:MAG: preprotein translocase subunit SecG [Candidatus Amesbacteria bacterium RIFOXYB1_FULL_44_23]
MKPTLVLVQLISAVAVSVLILLQAKGTGLGRTFGSATYHSKRGVEFLVFRATIILAVIFVTTSIITQVFM